MMELDAGAVVLLISQRLYDKLWSTEVPALRETSLSFYGYTGDALDVLGEVNVNVEVKDSFKATVKRYGPFVIGGSGHSLFG